MPELLDVDDVHRRLGGRPVLSGVSLHLAAGETVGLVGVSGAGKSTLLRLVSGLDRPDGGAIAVDARPVRCPRREVQTVAQDPRSALDPRWTAGRSIAEPLRAWRRDLRRSDRRARIRRLLEQVHLEPGFAERYPHELSTGQCQRVCLARALAPEPELLLLDEPLSALDLPVQARMLDLLREVRSSTGTACLFVSHDIVLVSAFCDRILVLHDGRIVEEVPAARLLTGAVHPHTRALVRDTPRPPESRRFP